MGGLSKKALQITNISTAQQKPFLFIDSGNLLFKQARIPEGPSQELLTAEGIIKIYRTMKVDAVAVGPLDLASGLELLTSSQQQGFPWLSANLVDEAQRPLFQPLMIKKAGRIKAGIIGLTGAVPSLPTGVTLADWRTLLPALLEESSAQCDILILLSSLSAAENQEIARQFPALHLILAADQRRGNMMPEQVNNTLITQTGTQGKYQGMLTIDWNKSGRWGQPSGTELTELRNRIGALDWQLQRMRRRVDLQQPDYLDKIKLVENDRETVVRQVEELEQALAAGHSVEQDRACTFNHTFLALERTMAEEPEIKAIVTGIKEQIHALHASRTRKEVDIPLLGHKGCMSCHQAQTDFWQETRHAKAYQTLVDKNQALNLDCLPCHVATSPGLTLSRDQLLSLPQALQTVGCENCHSGQGSRHGDNPVQFKMTRQVAEETCRSCHTTEQDTDFDYQKKSALIACPAG